MNCLITAIGSFSGEAVISSLRKNNINRIVGCDIYDSTSIPLSSLVDCFYQVPLAYENELYINKIVEIVLRERINYIIPLTDPEIDVLTKYRESIEKYDVVICMSNNNAINICRNKFSFYKFFKDDLHVNLIPTFLPNDISPNSCNFPMLAKPQNGRSSEGVCVIHSKEELKKNLPNLNNYVLQPLFKGNVFAVDLIRDDKCNKSFTVSRQELTRTTKGAGVSVEISFNQYLNGISEYIGQKLKINGCINIEFLYSDNKYYIMDINPRFSAGVSFSILAGYDMVINHLRCFTKDEIQSPIIYNTIKTIKERVHVSNIKNHLQ